MLPGFQAFWGVWCCAGALAINAPLTSEQMSHVLVQFKKCKSWDLISVREECVEAERRRSGWWVRKQAASAYQSYQ